MITKRERGRGGNVVDGWRKKGEGRGRVGKKLKFLVLTATKTTLKDLH